MRSCNPLDTRCLGVPICLVHPDIRLEARGLASREPTRIGGAPIAFSLANAAFVPAPDRRCGFAPPISGKSHGQPVPPCLNSSCGQFQKTSLWIRSNLPSVRLRPQLLVDRLAVKPTGRCVDRKQGNHAQGTVLEVRKPGRLRLAGPWSRNVKAPLIKQTAAHRGNPKRKVSS